MLFTGSMNKKRILLYLCLASLSILAWLFSGSNDEQEDFPGTVKLALRDAGNQLLLANQDSTSLVLPVMRLAPLKYQLTFKSQLFINPDSLISIVQHSFKKAKLPRRYRVEVLHCLDQEVAYSFQIINNSDSDIVPCKGRILPRNCYEINVLFTKKSTALIDKSYFLYLFILVLSVFTIDYFRIKRGSNNRGTSSTPTYTTVGAFKFYPEQHKLIKDPVEISLSKKECELLAILVSNPNQIVTREELTKRVWEDNGVIVGRSLDTYISKLRKKLKEDTSIKLTNIHGVGYKLEI